MQGSEVQSRKSIKGRDQLIRTDVYRLEIADGQALTMYSSIVGACYYSGAVAAVPAIVGGKKMRLDKFLKVSRLIKRRTVANEACDAGRVMVNGKAAKASAQVKPGDVIEIQFGTRTVKAEVLQLQDTTKKEEAKELFRYL